MYKIKSSVGELRVLCSKYINWRKEIVKNRRVKFIHEIINDKTFFGNRKYNSVKDVIRYMKTTRDMWGTVWSDLSIRGSGWVSNTKDLLKNISNLPDEREVWLTEEMSFLFEYK